MDLPSSWKSLALSRVRLDVSRSNRDAMVLGSKKLALSAKKFTRPIESSRPLLRGNEAPQNSTICDHAQVGSWNDIAVITSKTFRAILLDSFWANAHVVRVLLSKKACTRSQSRGTNRINN